ncbi:hypothetical protein CIB48_g7061 [Xylaria polymorpha]|nr:hypothetical protein CIB48_g7061 [Xylaria polymorpha]
MQPDDDEITHQSQGASVLAACHVRARAPRPNGTLHFDAICIIDIENSSNLASIECICTTSEPRRAPSACEKVHFRCRDDGTTLGTVQDGRYLHNLEFGLNGTSAVDWLQRDGDLHPTPSPKGTEPLGLPGASPPMLVPMLGHGSGRAHLFTAPDHHELRQHRNGLIDRLAIGALNLVSHPQQPLSSARVVTDAVSVLPSHAALSEWLHQTRDTVTRGRDT